MLALTHPDRQGAMAESASSGLAASASRAAADQARLSAAQYEHEEAYQTARAAQLRKLVRPERPSSHSHIKHHSPPNGCMKQATHLCVVHVTMESRPGIDTVPAFMLGI